MFKAKSGYAFCYGEQNIHGITYSLKANKIIIRCMCHTLNNLTEILYFKRQGSPS